MRPEGREAPDARREAPDGDAGGRAGGTFGKVPDSARSDESSPLKTSGQEGEGSAASGQEGEGAYVPGRGQTKSEWRKAQKAARESAEVKYELREDSITAIRSIGRKSINDFTSEDIKKAEPWARRFYRELGVKSPFFRAWFGDWRAKDTTPIIKVTDRSDTRGLKKNLDTGWEINRSAKISGERHSSSASVSGYGFMPYVDGIIENAVLLDSAISDSDNINSLFYHYMYAVVEDNTGNHIIKLTVEEMKNPGKDVERRAYKLIDIEKYQPSAGGSPKLTSSLKTDIVNSISDLFALVKRYDKNFHPKAVNPLLLNEDGTPKVFYHGTGARFTEFKESEMGAREGSYFFAQNREDAEGYGGKVMEVYLTADNLADFNNLPDNLLKTTKNKREIVTELKKRGYDGWYCDMETGWGEVSVFYPEQIKSATDNIGTFDGKNPDIRYELAEKDSKGDAKKSAEKSAERGAKSGARTEKAGYTAAEQDAARAAVRDFDTFPADTRRAILEWIRSAGDTDKKTISAVAGIMAVRPGLSVLRAKTGEGHGGLYTDLTKTRGRRLLVIGEDSTAVNRTLIHELIHDLEGTEGYRSLRAAAFRLTPMAKKLEITDLYTGEYGGDVKKYSEWLGGREATEAAWTEYLAEYPRVREDSVFSEITASVIAERLSDTQSGFLERYMKRSALSRAVSFLKGIGRALIGKKQSKAAQRETAQLIRLLERAMGEGATGAASGVKYSFKDSGNGMANDALLPYDKELSDTIRNRGDYIINSADELKEVVNTAFDDPTKKATVYFGIISPDILKKITDSVPNLPRAGNGKLFKNGLDYSVAATLDSIRHIADEKNLSRADIVDYLDRLADTIIDYDSVAFNNYLDSRKNTIPGLLFKKKFSDGTYISFDLISNKKRSLVLQSIYLDKSNYKKKRSAETPPMHNAPAQTLTQSALTSTPEVRASQTSDNSISQNSGLSTGNSKKKFEIQRKNSSCRKRAAKRTARGMRRLKRNRSRRRIRFGGKMSISR